MRPAVRWPRALHALLEGSVYCCTSQGRSFAQSSSLLAAASTHGQHVRHFASCTASSSTGTSTRQLVLRGHVRVPVEGLAKPLLLFAGFRTLLVVQGAALLWYVGPRQTVPITCKAVLACSMARGLHVLATNNAQVVGLHAAVFNSYTHLMTPACVHAGSYRQKGNIYLGLDTSR